MPSEETKDRLMDRNEVEQRYGIAKRFLEVAAVKGEGPAMVKIGRLVRYRASDIEAWIDRNLVRFEQS